MYTGACYRVKKCPEMFLQKAKWSKEKHGLFGRKSGCIRPKQKWDLQIFWMETGR